MFYYCRTVKASWKLVMLNPPRMLLALVLRYHLIPATWPAQQRNKWLFRYDSTNTLRYWYSSYGVLYTIFLSLPLSTIWLEQFMCNYILWYDMIKKPCLMYCSEHFSFYDKMRMWADQRCVVKAGKYRSVSKPGRVWLPRGNNVCLYSILFIMISRCELIIIAFLLLFQNKQPPKARSVSVAGGNNRRRQQGKK